MAGRAAVVAVGEPAAGEACHGAREGAGGMVVERLTSGDSAGQPFAAVAAGATAAGGSNSDANAEPVVGIAGGCCVEENRDRGRKARLSVRAGAGGSVAAAYVADAGSRAVGGAASRGAAGCLPAGGVAAMAADG